MALTSELDALSEVERRSALETLHPLRQEFGPAWRILLAALEGTGGFLTGDYLWRYPREESGDFSNRQKQARYHNYAKTLVNIYVRYLFKGGVKRSTSNKDLEAWWADVDGSGTKQTDFMKRATRLALAVSHCGVLVDKEAVEPTGPSKAEDTGKVIALTVTPLAVMDWRTERNGVTLRYVKIREVEADDDPFVTAAETSGGAGTPGQDTKSGQAQAEQYSYLLWNREEWARYDNNAESVATAAHDLGVVPVIVLRPEQSSQFPFLGLPLFGNANVFVALYNRCSEEDEVLRNSSFSMLAVSVGENAPEGAVRKAKDQIGNDVGTTRAIVVQGQIDYKTPDQSVPGSIRENIQFLIQEIYRMAHVFHQRDSRDSETAEAIKLKHNELQEMLVGLAEECERVENEQARLFFRWTAPSVAVAEKTFADAKITVQYPRDFFVADMMVELDKWAKALAMNLGKTAAQLLKKQAARALLPAADEGVLKTIDGEIDGQPDGTGIQPFPNAAAAAAAAAARMTGVQPGRPQLVIKPGEPVAAGKAAATG